MRINSYHIPNRTLSSYIPGRTKTRKDSCLVRGYWGDITNSPFIGFGVELNNKEEHEFFYAHHDVYYKYHSQHITEWNLSRYFSRLEKDELYELKFTEHKIRNLEEEQNNDKNNQENENKNDNSVLSTEVTFKEKKENKNENQNVKNIIEKKDDIQNIYYEKININENDIFKDNKKENEINNKNNENKEKNNFTTNNQESSEDNKDNILIGFEYFELKLFLITGEIDKILKKKK